MSEVDSPAAAHRRRHIVRLASSLDPLSGGIVSSLLATSRALMPDHAVTMLTPDPDPAHHAPFISAGVEVVTLPHRPGPVLRSQLEGADLAIIEGSWNLLAPALARHCRTMGIPYVYVPHGSLSSLVKRQFPARHVKKLAYWLLRERRVARRAARIWYSSRSEQAYADGTFPGLPRDGVVTPFASRDLGASRPSEGGSLRLVTAARVTPVKDLDVLLRALAASDEWVLDIAGPDDEAHADQLRELATTLGVADRVRWRGYLPPDELDALVRESHVYVCPGLESFGMAVAEALSADVPAVVSDAVALAPLVEGSGRVFARGDVDGLVAALRSLEPDARSGRRDGTARAAWSRSCSPEAFRQSFSEQILTVCD